MNEKKDNSNLLRSILVVCLVLLLGVSLTYAYFVRKVESNGSDTKTEVISGMIDVDFETTEYINNSDTWLINDSEVISKGDKNVFSVKRGANSTVDDVFYNIYMTNISITNNLKSSYFKWRLYNVENPTIDTAAVAEGNFSSIGNNTKIQLNQAKINLPDGINHKYVLYVWISNDNNIIQNEMLEGTFEAKILIEAATR